MPPTVLFFLPAEPFFLCLELRELLDAPGVRLEAQSFRATVLVFLPLDILDLTDAPADLLIKLGDQTAHVRVRLPPGHPRGRRGIARLARATRLMLRGTGFGQSTVGARALVLLLLVGARALTPTGHFAEDPATARRRPAAERQAPPPEPPWVLRSRMRMPQGDIWRGGIQIPRRKYCTRGVGP